MWALKTAETGFRHSIDQATRELLFLPVAEQVRRRAKAFIEGILKPASQGIAGLAIAGAAAYNEFLDDIRQEGDPQVDPSARFHMTSQTVAHVLVIIFVILGNIGVVMGMLRGRRRSGR